MSVKKQYKKLLESEVFRKWKDNNHETYFAHAFAILDSQNNGEWQFGFYNPDNDMITTFFMGAEAITHSPETEIAKHDTMKVNELDIEKVEIDFEEALQIAEKCQENNYEGDKSLKKVMILQNLSDGLLWNISFLTIKFSVINIRIDAITKEIIEHKKASMMDFASPQKGGESEHSVNQKDSDTNYIL